MVWNDDEQRLDLIVKGKVVSLPQTFLDDFVSVLMTVYGGEDPGVSIDPGPIRNVMNVRYIGKVSGTKSEHIKGFGLGVWNKLIN